jgi:hypothetical protein
LRRKEDKVLGRGWLKEKRRRERRGKSGKERGNERGRRRCTEDLHFIFLKILYRIFLYRKILKGHKDPTPLQYS